MHCSFDNIIFQPSSFRSTLKNQAYILQQTYFVLEILISELLPHLKLPKLYSQLEVNITQWTLFSYIFKKPTFFVKWQMVEFVRKNGKWINLLLFYTVQLSSYLTRLLYYIRPHVDYEDNEEGVLLKGWPFEMPTT